MKTVRTSPTKSGNGFHQGMEYTWTHYKNGLYSTVLPNGQTRYESLDPEQSNFIRKKTCKSAHLWDGVNWHKAGYFRVLLNQ